MIVVAFVLLALGVSGMLVFNPLQHSMCNLISPGEFTQLKRSNPVLRLWKNDRLLLRMMYFQMLRALRIRDVRWT